MATIYNKILNDSNAGDIVVSGAGTTMVVNGYGEWTPIDGIGNGLLHGHANGKSMTMSVLEEWSKEQDLEAKYPALAAVREQYNIIKAMCQETEDASS